MKAFTDEQVMLGTWGEVWIDGDYMAEVTKFRAEVTISYTDVNRVRSLMTGKKMTGISGEGEVTLHKTSSFLMKKISEALQQGKAPSVTIIGKLSDPNAVGSERVALYDCKFEKTTLADWEHGNLAEENYSFTFGRWELLDTTN